MQKILIYLFIICSVVIPTSCEDHFDIDPKTEILEEDLFSKELGYYHALYGIYLKLNQENLYGKTLTYDLLEDFAQSYNGTSYRMKVYDYFLPITGLSGITFHDRLTDIWERMYNIIAECNNLLENLEASTIEFPGGNREMVKAEALAIRAFLHFDLLRMFAPSVISGAESPAIPYVNNFTLQDFPQLTVNQVLNKIIADLKNAESLLQVHDPIFVDDFDSNPSLTELFNTNLIRRNREARMNYYSVLGVLSRVQLYAGNKVEAYDYAKKVIEADRFKLSEGVSQYRDPLLNGVFALGISYDKLYNTYNNDFIVNERRDVRFSQLETLYEADLIGTWEVTSWNNHGLSPEQVDTYNKYFAANGGNGFKISRTTSKLLIWEDLLEINDTLDFVSDNPGDHDFRLFENFYGHEEPGGNMRVKFFKFPDLLFDFKPGYLRLLKLNELYLIAAETAPDLSEGLNYLNEQRASANVPPLLAEDIVSAELLQAEIEKEYKKELLGEGQLFFYFKRLNLSSFTGANGVTVPDVNDEIYVLPIPSDQGF